MCRNNLLFGLKNKTYPHNLACYWTHYMQNSLYSSFFLDVSIAHNEVRLYLLDFTLTDFNISDKLFDKIEEL